MRTRFLDSMTNGEVTAYLRRSDVIFLPVGSVEMNGELPLGCEHVLPLAFAARMAEEVDALVLPHLTYFYAGATAMGKGTVSVRPQVGAAYLKDVFGSLLRHGFRRQVVVTAHGPAHITASLAIREFFEETKCPVVYLDLLKHLGPERVQGEEHFDLEEMLWGAYHLLGRLNEIPEEPRPAPARAPYPESLAKLQAVQADVGYYFSDESHHGWWPERPPTPEERQAHAEAGAHQIEAIIAAIDPKALVANLKDLDRFVQHHVLPKFEGSLP